MVEELPWRNTSPLQRILLTERPLDTSLKSVKTISVRADLPPTSPSVLVTGESFRSRMGPPLIVVDQMVPD